MGFAMSACLKFMALFLLLGKLLLQVGAMDFVLGLSRALFGSGRTGPPLMAVMSSTLIGTVSGSAKWNVYDWGNMTILLMRRVGIPRELAEAIETAGIERWPDHAAGDGFRGVPGAVWHSKPDVTEFSAKACVVAGGIPLPVPPPDGTSVLANGTALCMIGVSLLLPRMLRQGRVQNRKSGSNRWPQAMP